MGMLKDWFPVKKHPSAKPPCQLGSYVKRLQRPCVYPALAQSSAYAESCFLTHSSLPYGSNFPRFFGILENRYVSQIAKGLPLLQKHRARQLYQTLQLSILLTSAWPGEIPANTANMGFQNCTACLRAVPKNF